MGKSTANGREGDVLLARRKRWHTGAHFSRAAGRLFAKICKNSTVALSPCLETINPLDLKKKKNFPNTHQTQRNTGVDSKDLHCFPVSWNMACRKSGNLLRWSVPKPSKFFFGFPTFDDTETGFFHLVPPRAQRIRGFGCSEWNPDPFHNYLCEIKSFKPDIAMQCKEDISDPLQRIICPAEIESFANPKKGAILKQPLFTVTSGRRCRVLWLNQNYDHKHCWLRIIHGHTNLSSSHFKHIIYNHHKFHDAFHKSP